LKTADSRRQFAADASDEKIHSESAAVCGLPSAVSPSEHQLQAYRLAIQAAVGLLVGSPGTGKTWLVGRIIDTIQRSGGSYAVCAPTGKAALRVMESLKAQGITVMATTIHKLLCPQVGRDGWEFTFGVDCKLPYDFIIVDESSMIDIGLLKSLLDAVKDEANVLFVGDHEQLPPVGKGAPLRDMIQSGVPCGKLTEIRRNAGEIVKACAAIRDKMPLTPMPRHFEAEENLIFCRQTPLQENTFITIKSIIEFTHSNGAGEHPDTWKMQFFAGQKVVVIPDADKPGMDGGTNWAHAIAKVAESVRLVPLYTVITEKHGKDLRDWLNEGHSFADLEELVESTAPLAKPDTQYTPEFCEKMLKDLNVCIFGQDEEQRIHGYSFHCKRWFMIKDRNRYTPLNLIGDCGTVIDKHVVPTKSEESVYVRASVGSLCPGSHEE